MRHGNYAVACSDASPEDRSTDSVKIGIYNEPGGGPEHALGGSEYLTARLAVGLAGSHDVEFVHHRAQLTVAALEALLGEPLTGVGLRYIAPEHNPLLSRPSWQSLRQNREWHRTLSEPYDLFINCTHWMPPFCRAPRGILIVLFPLFNPLDSWPWKPDPADAHGKIWQRLRRTFYDWEWHKRFDTYQTKVAISKYTRLWTRRWWDIDCEVVYPPVDTTFNASDLEKDNAIISVGRFVSRGVTKCQLEMMQAYRELDGLVPEDCEYLCAGALGESIDDRQYSDDVGQLSAAGRGRAQVLANLSRSQLLSTYARAKIFWHATGYGADTTAHPELAEHFGIVTVEAMAAGCVPVVINRGGQPEIVQHGVNGFVWDTLDELKSYTLQLLRDDPLRVRMAAAARERARSFSGSRFCERFDALVRALE